MAKKSNYSINIIIGGEVDKSLGFSVDNALKMLGGIGAGVSAAKIAAKGIGTVFNVTKDFISDSIEEAKHYESAMADVAKVVDGLKDENGATTEAYKEMSAEILDLSTQVPKSAEDIAKIVEAAGQSNIESDQLIDFAEAAVKMSVAFDTTAEEAGNWMAVWRTSMNLTQDEVESLADQINYLGNTSSENALKISGVVTDVGSLGKIAGLSAGEIAALAAATTGVETSVAGTGIKNMIVALSSGTSATKKQTAAFDKLGISATKLSVRMQTDAQGAILDVLDAINKLPGSEQTAVIKDIFGKTSLETVAKLAGNVDNLRTQLNKINDPTLFSGSMEQEFLVRSATYENQLTLWRNTWDKFKIETGSTLLESLNEISQTALPEISAALDEISPVIEEVIGNIDISDLITSVVETIPGITGFITDTLPLVPGTIQSMITLTEELMPLVEDLVYLVEMAVAGFSLITGDVSTAEAIFDRIYGEEVEKTYSAMSDEDRAVVQADIAARASAATGVTGVTGRSTTVPILPVPPGRLTSGPYTFGIPSATTSSGGTVTAFASGGIVTEPTFALIGEAGEDEAVIPLSRLESMLNEVPYNTTATTITFSPVINAPGGDPDVIHEVMSEEYERFKKFMNQYMHENKRVKF